MRRLVILLTALLVLGAAAALPAGAQSPDETAAEAEFLDRINQRRSQLGLAPLGVYWDLVDDARAHSRYQADGRCSAGQRICHSDNLGRVADGWHLLGENVGVGYEVAELDRAFWESPTHQANVVGNYNYAGVGVVIRDDGTLYVTVLFMRGEDGLPAHQPGPLSPGADRPALYDAATGAWWSTDGADSGLVSGAPGDQPLACDWNGDGTTTVGLFQTGHLSLGEGAPGVFYGSPGDVALCGDWDGDGVQTIGVFRPESGTVFLRNTNSIGPAHAELRFGEVGDVPIAGDWFGTGYDSVAMLRPATGTLYLTDGGTTIGNVLAIPGPVLSAGEQLIAGDWDGTGADALGVYRPATSEFHLSLGLDPAADTVVISADRSTGSALAGRW
ncbi:MAG: CAP domain-containing protein [Acidimicrobiia bacterium]|nr:CAP domain-containing protein [Acidimicrobiia bacterium]NNF11457.1 CAP domain-containing protein [Acidimicrobiia bacterium]NNL69619.1 CAP domain-containing protein [Acidimicrobiia bacterium]